MRVFVALLVAGLVFVECMPSLNVGGLQAGEDLDGLPSRTDDNQKSTRDITINQDGVAVNDKKRSYTESTEESESYDKANYDQTDGSGSVHNSTEIQKKHAGTHKHEEKSDKGIAIGQGGLNTHDNKEVTDEKATSDSERGKSTSQSTATGDYSRHEEKETSEYEKEKKTRDKQTTADNRGFSLGSGGQPKFTEDQRNSAQHDEEASEKGKTRKLKKDYSEKDGNTRRSGSLSENTYNNNETKSTQTKTQSHKETPSDDEQSRGRSIRRRVPEEIYMYLDKDTKTDLNSENDHRSENLSKPNPEPREDYLLAIAQKILSNKIVNELGNSRTDGNRNNGKADLGSVDTDSKLRSLAMKVHSPVSSHYANSQIIQTRFDNLPSRYTGRKSTDGIIKTPYINDIKQNGRHKTDNSPNAANTLYKVASLQLSPAEWEERSRRTANRNKQNRSSQKFGSVGQMDNGFGSKVYYIDPDVKNIIFTQSVGNILKIEEKISKSAGNVEKIKLIPRNNPDKIIINSKTGEVKYSNSGRQIDKPNTQNVANNFRYLRTRVPSANNNEQVIDNNSSGSEKSVSAIINDVFNKEVKSSDNNFANNTSEVSVKTEDIEITEIGSGTNTSVVSGNLDSNKTSEVNEDGSIKYNDSEVGTDSTVDSSKNILKSQFMKLPESDNMTDTVTIASINNYNTSLIDADQSNGKVISEAATLSDSQAKDDTDGTYKSADFNSSTGIKADDSNKNSESVVIESVDTDSNVKTQSDITSADSMTVVLKSVFENNNASSNGTPKTNNTDNVDFENAGSDPSVIVMTTATSASNVEDTSNSTMIEANMDTATSKININDVTTDKMVISTISNLLNNRTIELESNDMETTNKTNISSDSTSDTDSNITNIELTQAPSGLTDSIDTILTDNDTINTTVATENSSLAPEVEASVDVLSSDSTVTNGAVTSADSTDSTPVSVSDNKTKDSETLTTIATPSVTDVKIEAISERSDEMNGAITDSTTVISHTNLEVSDSSTEATTITDKDAVATISSVVAKSGDLSESTTAMTIADSSSVDAIDRMNAAALSNDDKNDSSVIIAPGIKTDSTETSKSPITELRKTDEVSSDTNVADNAGNPYRTNTNVATSVSTSSSTTDYGIENPTGDTVRSDAQDNIDQSISVNEVGQEINETVKFESVIDGAGIESK